MSPQGRYNAEFNGGRHINRTDTCDIWGAHLQYLDTGIPTNCGTGRRPTDARKECRGGSYLFVPPLYVTRLS